MATATASDWAQQNNSLSLRRSSRLSARPQRQQQQQRQPQYRQQQPQQQQRQQHRVIASTASTLASTPPPRFTRATKRQRLSSPPRTQSPCRDSGPVRPRKTFAQPHRLPSPRGKPHQIHRDAAHTTTPNTRKRTRLADSDTSVSHESVPPSSTPSSNRQTRSATISSLNQADSGGLPPALSAPSDPPLPLSLPIRPPTPPPSCLILTPSPTPTPTPTLPLPLSLDPSPPPPPSSIHTPLPLPSTHHAFSARIPSRLSREVRDDESGLYHMQVDAGTSQSLSSSSVSPEPSPTSSTPSTSQPPSLPSPTSSIVQSQTPTPVLLKGRPYPSQRSYGLWRAACSERVTSFVRKYGYDFIKDMVTLQATTSSPNAAPQIVVTPPAPPVIAVASQPPPPTTTWHSYTSDSPPNATCMDTEADVDPSTSVNSDSDSDSDLEFDEDENEDESEKGHAGMDKAIAGLDERMEMDLEDCNFSLSFGVGDVNLAFGNSDLGMDSSADVGAEFQNLAMGPGIAPRHPPSPMPLPPSGYGGFGSSLMTPAAAQVAAALPRLSSTPAHSISEFRDRVGMEYMGRGTPVDRQRRVEWVVGAARPSSCQDARAATRSEGAHREMEHKERERRDAKQIEDDLAAVLIASPGGWTEFLQSLVEPAGGDGGMHGTPSPSSCVSAGATQAGISPSLGVTPATLPPSTTSVSPSTGGSFEIVSSIAGVSAAAGSALASSDGGGEIIYSAAPSASTAGTTGFGVGFGWFDVGAGAAAGTGRDRTGVVSGGMGEAPRGGVMDHQTALGGVVSAGRVQAQSVSSSTLSFALG